MKIRIDYERKLQKARCLAEKCAEENAKLNQQKNCLLMKLREEEAALKRAEQDAQKLRLTLRFERDVHREELIEICKQSSISNRQYQIQISEKYKSQLNDSLSTLRSQLEDQLRLNHMNFDNQIKSLHVVGTDAGGGAIASIMATQTSLTTIVSQITSLTSQVSECTATVDSLNLQKKYWEQILADDKAQMDNLEKTIKELCDKYSKLSEDKSKIQEELGHYSSILKGEESRLGLTDMCLPKLKSKIKPPNQTQSNVSFVNPTESNKNEHEFKYDYYQSN